MDHCSSIFKLPDQEISLNIEIHFHEQEMASVFLESNANGQSGNFGEVYLFTLFALRQLASLGKPQSSALATALLHVNSIIKDLATVHELGGVKIIPFQGYQGRKLLFARFTLGDQSQSFYFNTKGFGLFSRGIDYYSPTGVLVLFRYLAIRHEKQSEYLTKLAQAAQLCGTSYMQGKVGMTNQSQVAFMIIGTVLNS